jgi:MFS family permease
MRLSPRFIVVIIDNRMSSRTVQMPVDLRRARAAVAAAFFWHGVMAGSWATQIPTVKQDLGLGEGALGLALLGPAIGAIVAMPLTGAITVRRGSRSVTRAMLVVSGATLILPVLAPNLPSLFGALLFFGASAGAMDVAMNAQGVAVEKRYGRPILSSFHSMWSLGGFTGALAGSAAVGAGLGSVAHLLLVGAAASAGGSALTTGLLAAEADRSARGPIFARPSGPLAVMGGVAFCAMLAEGAAFDWTAVYLRESLGSGETLAAAAVAAFSFGMALGRLLGDRLTARFGPVAFVRAAAMVALAGLSAALAVRDPLPAAAGFFLLGAGLSSIVPVVFSRAGHSPAAAGASGIAAVATFGYTAFLVGPTLVGWVAEATTLRTGLAVVALLLVGIPLLAPGMGGSKSQDVE